MKLTLVLASEPGGPVAVVSTMPALRSLSDPALTHQLTLVSFSQANIGRLGTATTTHHHGDSGLGDPSELFHETRNIDFYCVSHLLDH